MKKQLTTRNNVGTGVMVWKLYALVYLIFGAFLAVALGTYSSHDAGLRVVEIGPPSGLSNKAGTLGAFIADVFFSIFGYTSWVVVVFCFLHAVYFARITDKEPIKGTGVGIFALFLMMGCGAVLMAILAGPDHAFAWGGVIGHMLSSGSLVVLGPWGSTLVWGVVTVVLALLAFHVAVRKWCVRVGIFPLRSIAKILRWGLSRFSHKSAANEKMTTIKPIKPVSPQVKTTVASARVPFAPSKNNNQRAASVRLMTGDYKPPPMELLVAGNEDSWGADRGEVQKTASVLVQKLKDFGIEGEVVHANPGPVITTFEFRPASGIKISKIANLSDDLTMALSSYNVRIVAPLPGKPSVGIEIPNKQRAVVYLRGLILSEEFQDGGKRLPLVLGRSAFGEPMAVDLSKMPHLLVAGATGTGKSVFINSVICGLLYRFGPKELRLIMIDPKMVELSVYEGVPHLFVPVVTQPSKAASALSWAVLEMERRYGLLHGKQVRHIDDYNKSVTGDQFLPYIVVIVDEFADLMITSAKEVEYCIARLAQKARAAGIHLILATQRPSVDVITGTIKANFTARVSFKVSSKIDSRTILDTGGGDRLLGKGDMLFTLSGASGLQRVHGAYVSDKEVHAVVAYFRERYAAQYDPETVRMIESGGEKKSGDKELQDLAQDPMFAEAVILVREYKLVSISFLQRKLRIGYNRAARIVEKMESLGWVSPSDGSGKPRDIRIPQDV